MRRPLPFLLLFLGTALVVGASLAAVWQGVRIGHERLEPLDALGLYVGDGVALFWFLYCIFVDGIFGKPLKEVAIEKIENPRLSRAFLSSLVVAMIVDLFFTAYQVYKEGKARDRSVAVIGEVYTVETRTRENGVEYLGSYRFKDDRGVEHRGFIETSKEGGEFIKDGLPPQVQRDFRLGKTPFPISIDFDPAWPGRHRPSDIPRLMDNASAIIGSFIALPAQLMGLGLFLVVLQQWVVRTRRIPWWYPLYQAAPFLGEVAFFVAGALYVRFI